MSNKHLIDCLPKGTITKDSCVVRTFWGDYVDLCDVVSVEGTPRPNGFKYQLSSGHWQEVSFVHAPEKLLSELLRARMYGKLSREESKVALAECKKEVDVSYKKANEENLKDYTSFVEAWASIRNAMNPCPSTNS